MCHVGTRNITRDLQNFNGVACADYIVRSSHVAKLLQQGATRYACAGEDAKRWTVLAPQYELLNTRWEKQAW